MPYAPIKDYKRHCYTDASWAPEGPVKVATAIKQLPFILEQTWLHGNLKDNALSSAEAELIASVLGNHLALSLYGQLNEMILAKPT